ncbi:MAG: hypothetical protein UV38_C0001G0134 [candidate division TM6 bacterium GW2011_GWE2_42_60]|nr:MAG: hypothetical protein UV38_C0001G0134 [candidate division TM6 bacterium GW2011_GWE2_42_60]HBY05670.1 hypothetical protein [Candidatus Dependentiae bacterium]
METEVREIKKENNISSRFLLLGMVFTTLSVLFIFHQSSREIKVRDHYSNIKKLTPEKLAFFGGSPAEVKIGMYIRNFPEFNPVQGTFIADATVWFIFDPRLISVERVGQFSFERSEILRRSEPSIRIIDKQVFVRYDIRLRSTMEFDYHDFPFDGHRLNFTLANYFVSPAELNFDSARASLVLNDEIDLPGWNNTDRRVSSGYIEERLYTQSGEQVAFYPRVAFSFDFERMGLRHIISIFMPLLLIFFVALFTFAFDARGEMGSQTIALSVTAITAMIAYRFVIENMSPQVGYLMASDYIFMTFLVCCCVIFCANVFAKKISLFIRSVLSVVLQAVVIVTFFFVV